MKKIVLLVAIAMVFIGCTKNEDGVMVGKYTGIEYTPETISTAYGTAKVVYSDALHVVYEVQKEKDRIEKEGFGIK